MKTKTGCDVTALMLYSIDALPEDEVVSLANHVVRCRRCRKQLTDRDEFKAAIIACTNGAHAAPPSGSRLRRSPI
jgi:hypothetical protein